MLLLHFSYENIIKIENPEQWWQQKKEKNQHFLYLHEGHLYIDGDMVVENFMTEVQADSICSHKKDEKCFQYEEELTM